MWAVKAEGRVRALALESLMGVVAVLFKKKKKVASTGEALSHVSFAPFPNGFADSNPGQLYGCLRCWNRRRSIPVGDSTVALF